MNKNLVGKNELSDTNNNSELKKVCHITRIFVKDKWGGTETFVHSIASALLKKGIFSPVLCTDIMAARGVEKIGSVLIRRFSYVFPWLFLNAESKKKLRLKGGSPLSFPLFFNLLKEKGISIIHTHVQLRMGGIARTVARLKGIPYVVSIHGGYLSTPKDQSDKMTEPFKKKLEWGKIFGFLFGSRRVLKDADGIICVSQEEFEMMQERFPTKRVYYLPNGVDTEKFKSGVANAFRKEFKIGNNEKLITCISRIDYQKNQLLLVKAFARFYKKNPNYRLVLIGAISVEDYLDKIVKTAEKLGIRDRVLIIPGLAQDNPLLTSAYKATEMFVLPTSHEPFGIVILEAWAAGLPVIATRIGGIPGFTTDNKNILLFEDKNEDMLLDKINLLAADNALRIQLIKNSQNSVKQYDWSIIGQRLRGIYLELINERNRKNENRIFQLCFTRG